MKERWYSMEKLIKVLTMETLKKKKKFVPWKLVVALMKIGNKEEELKWTRQNMKCGCMHDTRRFCQDLQLEMSSRKLGMRDK